MATPRNARLPRTLRSIDVELDDEPAIVPAIVPSAGADRSIDVVIEEEPAIAPAIAPAAGAIRSIDVVIDDEPAARPPSRTLQSLDLEPDEERPPAAPPQLTAGDLGRFADEGEVARGGMSSIRCVTDRRLGRRQAMKVPDAGGALDPLAMERFVYEARITAQLDHPNIVPIYDLGVAGDGAPSYLTMKLIAGESFADFLDRAGDDRLGRLLERALEILFKVCDALSFAHARGVIHCDIKPSNIMIGSHGQVYMMDWGLAVPTSARADEGWTPRALERGVITGTPAYMSPEQALGRVDLIDARTDVYGLGATLYKLLTGRPPHSEPTVADTVRKAQTGVVADPREVVRDRRLPPGLCGIVMKALAADPARRYQSMDALKEDLESFSRGGGWLPVQAFAEGDVIVREGDEADAAYIVVTGAVEAYKTVAGQRVPLRLMGPGEVFGEAAVFTSQPRTASVVAKTDVTVKVITADSLQLELEQSHNTWLAALVKALAERFHDLDSKLTRQAEAAISSQRSPDR